MTRKGYSKRSAIPPEILDQLNQGTIASATLAEGLAIDFTTLLHAAAPATKGKHVIDPAMGLIKRMARAAEVLHEELGPKQFQQLASHPSDTVRGWASYIVAMIPDLSFAERLERIRPLADDPHFGVREWAWIAMRNHIATNLDEALDLFKLWVVDPSVNIRRFASESTRPRGVWCAHIERLKKKPSLGLPILEPLHGDPTKYVQDSVANWLNDASKSDPDWVRSLCKKWLKKSATSHTARICQRALRSLDKDA